MKLQGRHMLSRQSLLLVAACLSCDAFKLQGVSFDGKFSVSDMKGAANVAQLAYQQQKISTNTWKALSNVSCFLEAARSAGLAWKESDAENHIVSTANVLKSKLDANSNVSLVSLGKPGKMSYPGLSDILGEDDKADLQDEALGATAGLVTSWIQTGKPPSFEDIAQIGIGLAVTALGMVNPILGAVAGMAFSLISGILFPADPNDSPEAQMYKKIMEDVGIAIENSQVVEEIGDASLELQSVMDELQWMPEILGGVKTEAHEYSDEQARILLTYNIMIQHDISKIAYKIQNSKFGKAETQPATNEWSAAMFPLAEQLLLLQINLLFDIAAHDFVDNVNAAAARISNLLGDWKKWIISNILKAHHANADQAVKTLNWRVTNRKYNDRDKHLRGRWKKGACEISGIDACTAMKCGIERDIDCGKFKSPDYVGYLIPSTWCNGACYMWTAVDFYWQYLAPKVEKLQDDVDKMITTIELGSGSFQKMGLGQCRSTRYAFSTVKDKKHCADTCRSERDCRFFAYRPSNKVCSRYNSETCDLKDPQLGHETYRHATLTDAVQKIASKKRCAGGEGAFQSDHWAAATGSKDRNSNFDSADFKKWVEVAWAKCLQEVITTKHVTVFDNARFRCHTESTCRLFNAKTASVWTGKPAALTMKEKGQGWCKDRGYGKDFKDRLGMSSLNDKARGRQGFHTDQYMAWVRQAWTRCFARNTNTKWVSVFTDGQYTCFVTAACDLDGKSDVKTWAPAN